MSDLRDVAEALKATSKSVARIESDNTDTARAVEEISRTLATLTEAMRPLEDMAESYAEVTKSLASIPDMVRALGTLTGEVMALGSRLNTYVDSTATQNGGLRARMTTLEQRVGVR